MERTIARTTKSAVVLVCLVFAFAVGLHRALAAEPVPTKPAAMPASSPPETDPDILEATRLMDHWGGDGAVLAKVRSLLAAALERNPKSSRAYRRLARVEMLDAMETSDHYDEAGLARAQKALDRAIELEPTKGDAFVLRSDIDRLQRRFEESEVALKHAEALGSDAGLVAQSRAFLLQAQGRYAEAIPLCERAKGDDGEPNNGCLMDSYEGLGRVDDVERLHKAFIAAHPDSAWNHGNYGHFLLCTRDRPDDAERELMAALERMDYGLAHRHLAAARYRQWSLAYRKGDGAAAERAWASAQAALPGDPAQILDDSCNEDWVLPVLKTLRDARRGTVLPPVAAVLVAAEKAPYAFAGIFALEAKGGALLGGSAFLNSESDYRDQRCLTIEFTPEAVARYRQKHGSDPKQDLTGKTLLVAGFAKRVRIDFMNEMRMPSGAFYYQTHVIITDPDQVSVVDPDSEQAPQSEQPHIHV
ncbi:hypothetical protein DWG18_07795 [Lysobacter sp. TY2-98]|uniref:tetratricopeptide repeat protein n=1 Tax=Lysobacter sp. TY2-98 TaxID=2290922 RepID=UPI000E1FE317|nr:hypothetical protein [Lysobacter sp. TY2-98]AXK72195.1 hypothetical protein DWG18_07795 [Lysobacter sp. TY2-98]